MDLVPVAAQLILVTVVTVVAVVVIKTLLKRELKSLVDWRVWTIPKSSMMSEALSCRRPRPSPHGKERQPWLALAYLWVAHHRLVFVRV